MAYQGLIGSIPLGQYGLLTDLAPGQLPANALIDANNVILNQGLIQKAPGTLIWNTSDQLSGSVVGLFDWWPETHLQRTIAATSAGNIYRDIGDRTFTSATAIKTGMGTLNPNCQFVEGGNEANGTDKKLFFFSDGGRQVQVLAADGTSFAEMENPAADWVSPNFPKLGLIHRNRLWAFMGQAAYASDTGDHEQFTSNNLIQYIFPGEGGAIRGAFVYKGRLFAFKEGGFVYFLNESASDSSTWYWEKLENNFGLAGPNAIFQGLNDMIALNDTGTATSYAATDAFGDIESADLMRNLQMENFLRSNFSLAGLSEAHALYYEAKKMAFITYRSTYKSTNDMMWVIDANLPSSPRITYWAKGSPQCLALKKHNNIRVPMYGSADGYIHIMDYEDRLEGAASYEGVFQTAYTDFRELDSGLQNKQKHFDFLWVEYVAEGNWDLSIDVFIDGKFIETITTPMQAQADYLNEFLLDTDYLAQHVTQSDPIPLHGMGRRISFRCYNSGSNQSFQISSLNVGFRSGPDSSVRF